jgi:hypothetical protein
MHYRFFRPEFLLRRRNKCSSAEAKQTYPYGLFIFDRNFGDADQLFHYIINK